MANTTNSNISVENVVKRWSDIAGKIDQYLIQEVDYLENGIKKHAVALVDKESGSISAQVNNMSLADALKELFNRAGDTSIDPAVTPLSSNDTNALNSQSATVPSTIGLGYGLGNAKTTTAQGLSDFNKQPSVPVNTQSAQEQLATKNVDVTDVTPAPNQSRQEAVKSAVPDGATATVQGVPVDTSKLPNEGPVTAPPVS